MRFLIFMLFGIAVLPAFSQDFLRNRHYKVRFSIEGNYQTTYFNCLNVSDQIYQYKTYRAGPYARYDRKVQSGYLLNPEIKIDFELPLWLKITCGVAYTRVKYSIRSPRYSYSSYYTYAPGSTPHNPIVTGSNVSSRHSGYNTDQCEIDWVSTFAGLGISKQYNRFNFDIDYSLALSRAVYAFATRQIHDIKYNQTSTQTFKFMEDYITQKDLVLIHQVSSSVSFRIYRHLHLKTGLHYSTFNQPVEDKTYQYYTNFKRMRSFGFIFGVTFSVL